MRPTFLYLLSLLPALYFGQTDLVSAGSTTYSNGYEISDTYGQIFRYQFDGNGYVILEGIQQPFVTSGLSIDTKWKTEHIAVYPNPSTDIFKVECPLGFNLQVYDSQGRLCKQLITKESITYLGLGDLAKGQYTLVFLKNEGYVEHRKVILQ